MNENDSAQAEDAQQTGNAVEESVTTETNTENGDPLDAISDVDQLREKARGYRAAYNRVKGDKVEKKEPPPPPSSKVLTQEDFYKVNEKRAKEILEVSGSDEDKEIIQNFDAVFDYYIPRSGKDTEKAIIKDLRVARAAWRYENPLKDTTADDAKRNLTASSGTRGKSTAVNEVKKDDSRFALPKGPKDWYKKSEE